MDAQTGFCCDMQLTEKLGRISLDGLVCNRGQGSPWQCRWWFVLFLLGVNVKDQPILCDYEVLDVKSTVLGHVLEAGLEMLFGCSHK